MASALSLAREKFITGCYLVEKHFMVYKLARLLQLAGLVVLPIAISGNIAERAEGKPFLSEPEFLALAAVGVLLFVAGWLLQQGSRPK